MKKYLLFPTLFLFILLSACSKNKDKTAPVINIQSPELVNNSVRVNTVPIEVRLTDNEMISEVNYTLRIVDDFRFVFFTLNETVKPNKPEYTFNYTLWVGITQKATYKLVVTAYDKSGNRTVEDRVININQ
jgi:dimeric dUTPase (all-alpha-NTP-PPase superfamily)